MNASVALEAAALRQRPAPTRPFTIQAATAGDGFRYFRAEFGSVGANYAVKVVPFSDPPQFVWMVLTVRNRELECERADVDATSAEMDSAEAAVLEAEGGR